MDTAVLPILDLNLGNQPALTFKDLNLAKKRYRPAIFTFQEGRDRVAKLGRWLVDNPDYDDVPFSGPGCSDTPILFLKERCRLVDFWSVLVAEETKVGDGKAHSGAGPDTINPKSVCVAVFRDLITGRFHTVINNHLIASWTRTEEYLGHVEWENRRDYGSHQLRLIVREARNVTKGAVEVTGDFNATKKFELMRPLLSVVDLGNTASTHTNDPKDAPIDFVGVAPNPDIVNVERVVLHDFSSDHFGLLAEIEATVRPRWAALHPAA